MDAAIAADPAIGDVIIGLRGIRKMRFSLRNKGKRGGGRAVYFLMISDDMAIMLLAYAKTEQSDLTTAQRKAVLDLLKEFQNE